MTHTTWSKESQERWKSAATIFSLVAVPIVVALAGWTIQERISAETIKKEYVQIALSVLREAPNSDRQDDQDLRVWAADIVDGFAPIKLSTKARDELIKQRLGVGSIEWDMISEGRDCRSYLIITGDNDGFEECVKRWREKAEVQPLQK